MAVWDSIPDYCPDKFALDIDMDWRPDWLVNLPEVETVMVLLVFKAAGVKSRRDGNLFIPATLERAIREWVGDWQQTWWPIHHAHFRSPQARDAFETARREAFAALCPDIDLTAPPWPRHDEPMISQSSLVPDLI